MFKLLVLYYWLKLLLRKKLSNRQELEIYQAKKIAQWRKNVLAKSSFYQSLPPGKYPVMQKQLFMENFDLINTVGILQKAAFEVALSAEKSRDFSSDINGITIGLSTGTSGKRGLFLVSKKERAFWTALVITRVIRPKLLKKQRVAFFLRANSNLYSSVSSGFFEFKFFDIFRPIDELSHELQLFNPHILAGQPSVIKSIGLSPYYKGQPHQIISFAEVLDESDKQWIKNRFNCKLSEVYQCTEGFLGSTCSEGTMHLHEDLIKVDKDFVDEHHFHPVITDFSRTSQPVVNYKMDDLLVLKATPCPCGSPFLAIEKIIGRNDDVLEFDGKKLYPDLVARRIALATNQFEQYTLTQTSPNSLLLGIKGEKESFETVGNTMKQSILDLLEENEISNVQIEITAELDYHKGDKLRKIKKKFISQI